MGLQSVDSIFAQLVYDFQITRESAWVLVVLGGNIGLDRIGELKGMSPAEGDLEDVSALHPGRLRSKPDPKRYCCELGTADPAVQGGVYLGGAREAAELSGIHRLGGWTGLAPSKNRTNVLSSNSFELLLNSPVAVTTNKDKYFGHLVHRLLLVFLNAPQSRLPIRKPCVSIPSVDTSLHHRHTTSRTAKNIQNNRTNMAEHQYKFNVTMTCGGCSGAVERVLKKMDGKP